MTIHLTMNDLPPFAPTPVDEIATTHQRVVGKFLSHDTRPIEYRLKQLRQLYWGVKDAEPTLLEATKLDLGKSAYEAFLCEVGWVLNDILFVCKNLAKWMKEEKAQDMDIINRFVSPRIRKDPLGAVLVIGAYNFPIQLSLGPLVGAIAAGCKWVLSAYDGVVSRHDCCYYALVLTSDSC